MTNTYTYNRAKDQPKGISMHVSETGWFKRTIEDAIACAQRGEPFQKTREGDKGVYLTEEGYIRVVAQYSPPLLIGIRKVLDDAKIPYTTEESSQRRTFVFTPPPAVAS